MLTGTGRQAEGRIRREMRRAAIGLLGSQAPREGEARTKLWPGTNDAEATWPQRECCGAEGSRENRRPALCGPGSCPRLPRRQRGETGHLEAD